MSRRIEIPEHELEYDVELASTVTVVCPCGEELELTPRERRDAAWEAGRVMLTAASPQAQSRLFEIPPVGLYPMDPDDVNRLLDRWGHELGPCERPYTQQGWALELDGYPISVALSASTVSPTVAGYRRTMVVELARLCAQPDYPWANRIMLRLWREVCAPRWPDWPVQAAVSYSLNTHTGNLYRFDGWEKRSMKCGSRGGGTYSRKRDPSELLAGKKTLWIWRYAA